MDSSSSLPIQLPPAENKRFYPALNGLRAVGVLMVFFEHYVDHGNVYPSLHWGWAGVNLFFVLSGFLITGILFDTRERPHYYRNFYARRALRIFPLYYGVLLVALLVYPFVHWQIHITTFMLPLYLQNFSRVIWHDLYMHSLGTVDHLIGLKPKLGRFSMLTGHFWSLAVEEQFYLFWPLVVFSIRKISTLRNVCILTFLALVAAKVAGNFLIPASYLDTNLLYMVSPLCMDALVLGGLLAALQRGPEFARVQRWARPGFYTFIAGFALYTAIYYAINKHVLYAEVTGLWMTTLGFALINVFCAIVILLAIEPGSFMYRALNHKPLLMLGEVSYGFYIFHDLYHLDILNSLRHVLHIGPYWEHKLTALIAFPLTVALAYLSFRFFEAPILRLKARF